MTHPEQETKYTRKTAKAKVPTFYELSALFRIWKITHFATIQIRTLLQSGRGNVVGSGWIESIQRSAAEGRVRRDKERLSALPDLFPAIMYHAACDNLTQTFSSSVS